MRAIICSFLLCASAFGLNTKDFPIAKAIMTRGNVTVLMPGELEAVNLKKGMMLKKDSSVLVSGKGFARIKFINDSLVTLGPDSKMIVEMDTKTETSLVNLVTGKIRAAVKKKSDKPQDKRFLVKTTAAVMGVRGTEFQVTFNPKSLRSSLLTYEGRVDFKKQELEDLKAGSKKSLEQTIAQVQAQLEKNPEPVRKGDFTNVALGSKASIKPVKINPAQFALLKKDESLGAEKVELSKKEKQELKKEVAELEKEFKADLAKKGVDTSKLHSMGFIDSETGFYVPPADAKSLIGKVNTNGEYLPPAGVKVDPKKGLVLEKNAPKESIALVKKVEKEIGAQAQVQEIDPGYRRYLRMD